MGTPKSCIAAVTEIPRSRRWPWPIRPPEYATLCISTVDVGYRVLTCPCVGHYRRHRDDILLQRTFGLKCLVKPILLPWPAAHAPCPLSRLVAPPPPSDDVCLASFPHKGQANDRKRPRAQINLPFDFATPQQDTTWSMRTCQALRFALHPPASTAFLG